MPAQITRLPAAKQYTLNLSQVYYYPNLGGELPHSTSFTPSALRALSARRRIDADGGIIVPTNRDQKNWRRVQHAFRTKVVRAHIGGSSLDFFCSWDNSRAGHRDCFRQSAGLFGSRCSWCQRNRDQPGNGGRAYGDDQRNGDLPGVVAAGGKI